MAVVWGRLKHPVTCDCCFPGPGTRAIIADQPFFSLSQAPPQALPGKTSLLLFLLLRREPCSRVDEFQLSKAWLEFPKIPLKSLAFFRNLIRACSRVEGCKPDQNSRPMEEEGINHWLGRFSPPSAGYHKYLLSSSHQLNLTSNNVLSQSTYKVQGS